MGFTLGDILQVLKGCLYFEEWFRFVLKGVSRNQVQITRDMGTSFVIIVDGSCEHSN